MALEYREKDLRKRKINAVCKKTKHEKIKPMRD